MIPHLSLSKDEPCPQPPPISASSRSRCPRRLKSSHMGHADFRVGGKIFATLDAPEKGYAMVKLSPEEQEMFLEAEPKMFTARRRRLGPRRRDPRQTESREQDDAEERAPRRVAAPSAQAAGRKDKQVSPSTPPSPCRERICRPCSHNSDHSSADGGSLGRSRGSLRAGVARAWAAGAPIGASITHAGKRSTAPTRRRSSRPREARPAAGLLAFEGEVPVGWVQVTPRDDVPAFNSPKRLSAPAGGEAPARASGRSAASSCAPAIAARA